MRLVRRLLAIAGSSVLHVVMATGGRRPHLIHIVADDVGWDDLGFTNGAMRTPVIDGLVREGVRLTRFYAQKECAPSRSSMMTGRLPFHYGYYENPSDDGAVPRNYTMIPSVLKSQGYSTHAIGKWHCGFKTADVTPTHRGFDSFLGFWHWGEEYVDHAFPPYYKDAKCRGVDFVNSSAGGPITPIMNRNGSFSTQVFLDEVDRVLHTRDIDKPLYVYFAFQNAHDPYELAPEHLVRHFSQTVGAMRRNFSAIVEDLDIGVGELVKKFKAAGIWGDTILWFNSDNGAELPFPDQSRCNPSKLNTGDCGGAGSNYPLRGGKFTLFEGGVRVHAFVHSPSAHWLPTARRGTEWNGMAHVADIFPTMAMLAGASLDAEAHYDGVDLWNAIVLGRASPRKELLHQPLNSFWNASCRPSDESNPFTPSCGAALTVWPYKLYIGFPGDNRVVATPSTLPMAERLSVPRDLCVDVPCLFDIEKDPSEATDLALQLPAKVVELTARLYELSVPEAAPQPADHLTPVPSDAACVVVTRTGAWQPWGDAADPVLHS
mmetsp:Transcript_69641/g.186816  ORF Transcript_69641/g.186816 Transcript_69641/m.186816 type:complete len:546 (-) Transcript_69641:171-1808(-)